MIPKFTVMIYQSFDVQGSALCPGQYDTKSFTDELAERVISKRGPYDLFTGDRNKPITVGYFAAPVGVLISLFIDICYLLLYLDFFCIVLPSYLKAFLWNDDTFSCLCGLNQIHQKSLDV